MRVVVVNFYYSLTHPLSNYCPYCRPPFSVLQACNKEVGRYKFLKIVTAPKSCKCMTKHSITLVFPMFYAIFTQYLNFAGMKRERKLEVIFMNTRKMEEIITWIKRSEISEKMMPFLGKIFNSLVTRTSPVLIKI